MIGRAGVMDAAQPGGLGGTYAGSPIACAAALAVLDVIADEGLCARADVLGEKLRTTLHALSLGNRTIPIGHIRGPGAMVAFDCLAARGNDAPDGAAAKALVARALDHGLVLLSCGIHGETIRLLMPLTVPDALVDEGLAVLATALTDPTIAPAGPVVKH